MNRRFLQFRSLMCLIVFGLALSIGVAAAADAPKGVGPDFPTVGHASRLDIKEVSVTLPDDMVLAPLDPGVPSGIGSLDPQSKALAILRSE